MRNLAQQSSAATSNIHHILEEIRSAAESAVSATRVGSQGTSDGMRLAGRAGQTIHDLTETIEDAARLAVQISDSTDQQANAMDQLVQEVKKIKEASAQTSLRFEEAGL